MFPLAGPRTTCLTLGPRPPFSFFTAPVWLWLRRVCASWTCLSCKSIHHSAEGCSNSLQHILTPRIATLSSTVYPASVFFHPHLLLCHFHFLHLPAVYRFSHRAVFALPPPPPPPSPVSSLARLREASTSVFSWTAKTQSWTHAASFVVLQTAVDVCVTQTHTNTHSATGCVGCVALPAGTCASLIITCSSITYSTAGFKTTVSLSPSVSPLCPLACPFMCVCCCFTRVFSASESTVHEYHLAGDSESAHPSVWICDNSSYNQNSLFKVSKAKVFIV